MRHEYFGQKESAEFQSWSGESEENMVIISPKNNVGTFSSGLGHTSHA